MRVPPASAPGESCHNLAQYVQDYPAAFHYRPLMPTLPPQTTLTLRGKHQCSAKKTSSCEQGRQLTPRLPAARFVQAVQSTLEVAPCIDCRTPATLSARR